MQWNGRFCLVTGASSGFGLFICRALAARGATVIAVARREQQLAALIRELGGAPHLYRECDISQLDQIKELAAWAAGRIPHLDVLINNAGIASSGPLFQSTSERMSAVLATNLLGPMWCTMELLPLIDAAPRSGSTPVVVNMASMAGRIPAAGLADYTASKFGLVGFTEASWAELKDHRIRTMMVNAGPADTEGFSMDAALASPLSKWVVMDAGRVAKATIGGIEKRSFEVRVQWWMHPVYHLTVLMGPLRRVVSGPIRRAFGKIGAGPES